MRITVEVPDGEEAQFAQLMAEKGYAVVKEDAFLLDAGYQVPEAHKEIVRQRRASTKADEYRPWAEIRKEWGLK